MEKAVVFIPLWILNIYILQTINNNISCYISIIVNFSLVLYVISTRRIEGFTFNHKRKKTKVTYIIMALLYLVEKYLKYEKDYKVNFIGTYAGKTKQKELETLPKYLLKENKKEKVCF